VYVHTIVFGPSVFQTVLELGSINWIPIRVSDSHALQPHQKHKESISPKPQKVSSSFHLSSTSPDVPEFFCKGGLYREIYLLFPLNDTLQDMKLNFGSHVDHGDILARLCTQHAPRSSRGGPWAA